MHSSAAQALNWTSERNAQYIPPPAATTGAAVSVEADPHCTHTLSTSLHAQWSGSLLCFSGRQLGLLFHCIPITRVLQLHASTQASTQPSTQA